MGLGTLGPPRQVLLRGEPVALARVTRGVGPDEVVAQIQTPGSTMGDKIVDDAVAERLRWLIGLHEPSSPTNAER